MHLTISDIPRIFNINRFFNIRGFNFFNSLNEEQLNPSVKCLLIFWSLAISLIWGIVRSHFSHQATLNASLNATVPLSLCFIFIILFALPAFLMVKSTQKLLWLLGASIVASSLPDIAAAPYINEGAYIIFMITGLALVITKKISFNEVSQNKVFKLFIGYIVVCVFSVLINKFTGGSAWQLKAGIVQLVLYISFAIVFAAFVMGGAADNKALTNIIDGYVWAALAQIIFVPFILPLVFQTSFVPETDAIVKTGILQQLQAASTEPNMGLLFAVSLPLMIWWLSVQKNRAAQYIVTGILLLTPWVMIFFGSQLIRLMALVALLFCMFRHSLRPHGLIVLLSCVLSFLYYQSFPMAAQTIENRLDGTLKKVRTVFSSNTLGSSYDAKLKMDSDSTIYDEVPTDLRASKTLSNLNVRDKVGLEKKGTSDELNGTPTLLDNNPPLLTEVRGAQLKFDSTIDPIFVISQKIETPEKLTAMTSKENTFQKNGWQANSLKEALSLFIKAPLMRKIVGFGAGTGEYRMGNLASSQVAIVKVLMETGLLGVLFLSGFMLLLLTGLWKKIRIVQNQNRDVIFVITIALAVIFCSAFIFSLQNWGFAMVVCIMAIIALLLNPSGDVKQHM